MLPWHGRVWESSPHRHMASVVLAGGKGDFLLPIKRHPTVLTGLLLFLEGQESSLMAEQSPGWPGSWQEPGVLS